MKNFWENIRRPQWKCCTFANAFEMHRELGSAFALHFTCQCDSEERKVTHLKAKSMALDDQKSPTFLQEVAVSKEARRIRNATLCSAEKKQEARC